MGIAGIVRDKDTELGIADAVISVDGINHDVTTGVCGGARRPSARFWLSGGEHDCDPCAASIRNGLPRTRRDSRGTSSQF